MIRLLNIATNPQTCRVSLLARWPYVHIHKNIHVCFGRRKREERESRIRSGEVVIGHNARSPTRPFSRGPGCRQIPRSSRGCKLGMGMGMRVFVAVWHNVLLVRGGSEERSYYTGLYSAVMCGLKVSKHSYRPVSMKCTRSNAVLFLLLL